MWIWCVGLLSSVDNEYNEMMVNYPQTGFLLLVYWLVKLSPVIFFIDIIDNFTIMAWFFLLVADRISLMIAGICRVGMRVYSLLAYNPIWAIQDLDHFMALIVRSCNHYGWSGIFDHRQDAMLRRLRTPTGFCRIIDCGNHHLFALRLWTNGSDYGLVHLI